MSNTAIYQHYKGTKWGMKKQDALKYIKKIRSNINKKWSQVKDQIKHQKSEYWTTNKGDSYKIIRTKDVYVDDPKNEELMWWISADQCLNINDKVINRHKRFYEQYNYQLKGYVEFVVDGESSFEWIGGSGILSDFDMTHWDVFEDWLNNLYKVAQSLDADIYVHQYHTLIGFTHKK